jgi:esterase/lipase superfamily enzyme
VALKVRKGYIIALIVIAIIFTGFYSLKFFFKKSLEEELNKVLNAQVKIGKIDLKFFAGQIQIRDILIIGQGEFENDTLISCEKLRLDLEDFDKKNKFYCILAIFCWIT